MEKPLQNVEISTMMKRFFFAFTAMMFAADARFCPFLSVFGAETGAETFPEYAVFLPIYIYTKNIKPPDGYCTGEKPLNVTTVRSRVLFFLGN